MNTTGGELPRGWAQAELQAVVDVLDGDRVPVNAKQRSGRVGSVPYYGATGQVGWIDDFLFDETLVLLGEDGAPFFDKTRHVAYVVSGKSWVNNHAHVLRAASGISSSLLSHHLNVVDYHAFVSGTTRWKLNQAPMRRILLRIPPASEQSRIADALDELMSDLDAGVAALDWVKAKLALYRASVLKAAVDGSLTAEWRAQHPHLEPASILLERILVERRRRWEEEQFAKFKAKGHEPPKNWKPKYKEPVVPDANKLPSLPEGWRWATVDQLLESPIVNGISVRGSDEPPGVPSLRLSAMSGHGFDYSERRYLPLKPDDVDDLWIRAGDFFVSRGNGSKHLVGRGTIAQKPPKPIIFPDTMMRLRLLDCGMSPRWISEIWGSGLIRKQVERIAKTTAGIWKIAQPDLANITVPLPPVDEQAAALETLDDQLSVVDHVEAAVEAKLKSAQSLRQAILRHAFTGQLVPQDPNDEPASELLKRIAAEREARAREAVTARLGSKRVASTRRQRRSEVQPPLSSALE